VLADIHTYVSRTMQAYKDNYRYEGEILHPKVDLPHADMMFKLVLNGWVRSMKPIDDLMFSAHIPRENYDLASGGNYTSYLPDVRPHLSITKSKVQS
jgi:hypothetical protein